jgi:hypothetical protein
VKRVRLIILSVVLLLFLAGCSAVILDLSDTARRSIQEGIGFVDAIYGLKGWTIFAGFVLLAGVTTVATRDSVYFISSLILSVMMIFLLGLVRL